MHDMTRTELTTTVSSISLMSSRFIGFVVPCMPRAAGVCLRHFDMLLVFAFGMLLKEDRRMNIQILLKFNKYGA